MTVPATRLACHLSLALAAAFTVALPAQAESFASSASSAGSASVGSLSDSIQGSSDSSSRATPVAQGEYRIERVAALPARDGQAPRVQLHLVPVAAAGGTDFYLALPRDTVEAQRLAAGDHVLARTRAYGLAFARVDDRQAFFLVLDDAARRDLDPRAVVL